jgi:hypothetical protein
MARQPEPTGTCWYGCGEETRPGRFFLHGHDGIARFSAIHA